MLSVIDSNGVERFLGNNPRPPRLAWTYYGAVPSAPLVPRSDWKSLVDALPGGSAPDWPYLCPEHDQDGVGQCNADATTGAMESQTIKQGLPYVALAAGDLYDRINGGSDNGSTLEDGLAEAMANGVGSRATCGTDVWHRGWRPAPDSERQLYRVLEAYLCPTFDHCFSAVLQGFDLISGVMWRNNFDPDKDGWLPAFGMGSAGGHAVHGFKPTYRGNDFGIWHQNSWGKWGIGYNGFRGLCVFPEWLYTQAIGGWWAVRQVVDPGTNPIP